MSTVALVVVIVAIAGCAVILVGFAFVVGEHVVRPWAEEIGAVAGSPGRDLASADRATGSEPLRLLVEHVNTTLLPSSRWERHCFRHLVVVREVAVSDHGRHLGEYEREEVEFNDRGSDRTVVRRYVIELHIPHRHLRRICPETMRGAGASLRVTVGREVRLLPDWHLRCSGHDADAVELRRLLRATDWEYVSMYRTIRCDRENGSTSSR